MNALNNPPAIFRFFGSRTLRVGRRGVIFAALVTVVLAGCATSGSGDPDDITAEDFQAQQDEQARADEINRQLMAMAVEAEVDSSVYRVGPNDSVRIDVRDVEDLSGEYRVDGSGAVNLPLVGYVDVSGYTLSELEDVVAEEYGAEYVRNPQVSARVTEFRSQQFTALGSVRNPRVYNTEHQVTLLEALAQAGGLSSGAGRSIYLTDRVRDPETGQLGARSMVIDVDELMRDPSEHNLVLGESALVNVPRAGSIFVEGRVNSPGVYSMEGETNVLKAITMAGGLEFQGSRSNVRVLSRDPSSGEWDEELVNFNEIRESPLADRPLSDGDIVVVESSAIRTGLAGSWEVIRAFTWLGFRPF